MAKFLFVAIQNSPHTARWVNCLADTGHELHMFGVTPRPPEILSPQVHVYLPAERGEGVPSLTAQVAAATGASGLAPVRDGFGRLPFHPAEPGRPGETGQFGNTDSTYPALSGPAVLAELIERLRPDLIHSMEFQACGYLTLMAQDRLGAETFPPWLATNWGSDIYLFGRDPAHATLIRRLLRSADLYSCECERDRPLADRFGYRGPHLPVLPNSGGMDLRHMAPFRGPLPPSRRRLIMVKGYDHFAGRALIALEALERLADELKGHEILVYSATGRTHGRVARLREAGRLNIRVLPWCTHDRMLQYFGRARLYLGVSISDGISTSALDAMAMGAFPIQTDTSCCGDWFEDGQGGFLVPPDDPDRIVACLRRSLADDALVDRAAEVNAQVVRERLDVEVIRPKVRDFYEQAFRHLSARQRAAE